MTANYRLGLALIVGATIAWSLAGLFTRLVTLDSWTILAWRGVFGALGMAVMMAFSRRGEAFRDLRRLGLPGWGFACLSALGMVFYITSLRNTTVAHNAVIYATIPFLAAGLGYLALGEKPSRIALAASGAALAGVAIMVGFGAEGGLLGDLLGFAMTVCMALMMVIARRWPGMPVLMSACLSALISAAVAWPLGAPLTVSGHELAVLMAFGLVNSALGLGLFTLGARHLPAMETALITALDAPLAPLWVWLLFGETPGAATIVGGLIVLVAVISHIATTSRRRVPVIQPA